MWAPEMRQLVNYHISTSIVKSRIGSPEVLARFALCRRLETRLVWFKDRIELSSDLYVFIKELPDLVNGVPVGPW